MSDVQGEKMTQVINQERKLSLIIGFIQIHPYQGKQHNIEDAKRSSSSFHFSFR